MSCSSPSSRIRLAGVTSLAVLALAGCQARPHALAHVGDRVITVTQFEAAAAIAAPRIMAPPDSAKAQLLDDLVRRELMLVAARGNAALPESYVTRRRREIEDDALSRALLDRLGPRAVGVSDAEVRQLYRWRRQETHCQIIFTTDAQAARMALAAVNGGEAFGSVAHRFDVTSMLPPGGDLGFIEAGALVDPLDRLVRETPVGRTVGPVETPGQGWFIIRVLARRPHEQGSFEQMEPELRSMLEQRKQRISLFAQYAALRGEYGITADPAGLRLLYQRVNAAGQAREPGSDAGPSQLSPQDRATIVGRWDGGPRYRGTLALGEAMDMIVGGRAGRFNMARLDAYEDWVKNTILQRVAVIEARRRHLDQEPEIAERIRRGVDDVLLQSVYQTEVVARAVPNDAEFLQAYEREGPAFAQLRSVDVQYLTLPDSAMAVRAAEKAMAAGTLKDAVMLASPKWAVREESLRFPTGDPLWKMLQPALTQQRVGGLIGPIQLADGWRIVQIIGRDAPVPPIDRLTPEQQEGLRQQARELAGERRLKFYTDSLRTVIPVVVDRQRFQRINWPAPNLMQLTPGMTGMPGS